MPDWGRLYELAAAQEGLFTTRQAAWQRRRFRVPEGVILHHGEVPKQDRTWFGPVGGPVVLAEELVVGQNPRRRRA